MIVQSRLDKPAVPVAGTNGWGAQTFVGIATDGSLQQALANCADVLGVAKDNVANAGSGFLETEGIANVLADSGSIPARAAVKVGSNGRATLLNTSPLTLNAVETGTATGCTQPAAPGVVKIKQAADTLGDRGSGIVVVGADNTGAAIFETINLNAANSTTIVSGLLNFKTIAGIFTANGNNLGASSATLYRADGVTSIVVMTNGTSQKGAQIPTSIEAFCEQVTHTNSADAVDVTYLTIYGYDSTDTLKAERKVLSGGGVAALASVTMTSFWKQVLRICTGEYTNAATGALTTVADAASLKVGRALAAPTAEGATMQVYLTPNV
jgi:hypothetical protein